MENIILEYQTNQIVATYECQLSSKLPRKQDSQEKENPKRLQTVQGRKWVPILKCYVVKVSLCQRLRTVSFPNMDLKCTRCSARVPDGVAGLCSTGALSVAAT